MILCVRDFAEVSGLNVTKWRWDQGKFVDWNRHRWNTVDANPSFGALCWLRTASSRSCKFRLFCWRSIFYSLAIIFHIHYYMFLVSFLVCILWMRLSWACCVNSSFGVVCFSTLTRNEADGIWNCVVALRDPMIGPWWVYRQVPHSWNWEKVWESIHGAQSSKRVNTQRFLTERDSTPTNAILSHPNTLSALPPFVHILFIFSLLTCFDLITAQWYKHKTLISHALFIHNQVIANELNAYNTEKFRTEFRFRDDCDFGLINYILHGLVSSCVKWSGRVLITLWGLIEVLCVQDWCSS